MAPLALVTNLTTRWRYLHQCRLHQLKLFNPFLPFLYWQLPPRAEIKGLSRAALISDTSDGVKSGCTELCLFSFHPPCFGADASPAVMKRSSHVAHSLVLSGISLWQGSGWERSGRWNASCQLPGVLSILGKKTRADGCETCISGARPPS